jgi:Flp pilus assembly protein TadG
MSRRESMLCLFCADRSGATAMEFGIIGILVLSVFFGMFDLGRYAITLHSLNVLADESARQEIICYSPYIAAHNVAAAVASNKCSGDPLIASNKQALAPFLYYGGLTPTVQTAGGGPHIVTASQPGFTMFMPFWPRAMNAPSTSVSLPF